RRKRLATEGLGRNRASAFQPGGCVLQRETRSWQPAWVVRYDSPLALADGTPLAKAGGQSQCRGISVHSWSGGGRTGPNSASWATEPSTALAQRRSSSLSRPRTERRVPTITTLLGTMTYTYDSTTGQLATITTRRSIGTAWPAT